MRPPKFEIFLRFPYFVTSQALSRLASRQATFVPILFYWLSSLVLLVAISLCIKTL